MANRQMWVGQSTDSCHPNSDGGAKPCKTAAISSNTTITLNTAAITADIAGSAPYSALTTAITANTTAITSITADISTNSPILRTSPTSSPSKGNAFPLSSRLMGWEQEIG
jgi:hypothetical protein